MSFNLNVDELRRRTDPSRAKEPARGQGAGWMWWLLAGLPMMTIVAGLWAIALGDGSPSAAFGSDGVKRLTAQASRAGSALLSPRVAR